MATRDPNEVVDASIRITSDSSFLRKYLNPNLLVVATTRRPPTAGARILPSVKRSTDPCINVYLIDGASGRVLEKIVHRGGQGPVQLV